MISPTLELARDLIARASVTPDDQGCQQLLAPGGYRIPRLIEVLNVQKLDLPDHQGWGCRCSKTAASLG